MRVIVFDPSYKNTGFAVVESGGKRLKDKKISDHEAEAICMARLNSL